MFCGCQIHFCSKKKIEFDDPINCPNGNSCKLVTATVNPRNKKYVTKGRWYFELNHLSGSNYYLAGFSNGGFLTFYNQGGRAVLYYGIDKVTTSVQPYDSLELKTNFTRIGIGIDIEYQIFYIQTAEEYRQYLFNNTSTERKWRVYLSESFNKEAQWTDYVEIIGDRNKMKLQIPPGFTPFNENIIEQSCPIISCMKYNNFAIMVFIFLSIES